ncbi:ABC transporter permease [Chryseobacterium indologenes]|uniref:ABC transporter permease n=3 Tax=Chryseobacterium indologenes TaxID=253 RepID=A0AAD0YTQ0_CHRID|nr:ABC transporter permease [Chryseobacterium indologenes]ASE62406.1 ABC transporter permease [Chryseobacterium indologenes]AYZ34669.1 ABC transporter permease [Chryseobacterium indologenes]AZB18120.1 ABC transporter permease [Chryseobacterium indologenes]MBF6643245.1 ABC transporter permease [Chryseobacterium indologenes]MEB4758921.1 ABC transporter permease [Chryseobacterium indologenes]
MNNIFLITKREFLTQVKKKSFIILTLLAPVLIVAFGAVIGLMFKANESHSIIEVVDKSGLFTNQFKSNDKVDYAFVSAADEKSKINTLKSNESIAGILILPELKNNNFDELETGARLVVNSKIGLDTKQKIVSDISNVIKKEKIKHLGIQEAQLIDLDKGFSLKTINVSDNNKEDSDLAFGVKTGLSMILMYVTFMFIIIYGVRVMRSVLEEKNNRVVEIIISSVKPFELMMGKILGVTLVALTQFVIWITMSVIGAIVLNTGFSPVPKNIPGGNEQMASKLDVSQLATQISHSLLEMNFPLIIFVFIIFFLLGYIFYSSIYAAIGSAVDNETETQQFTLFAVLPLMLGMYGSFSLMNNPDGPLGFWLSIIPFTSPVAMIARIPFGVPAWQIALSIVLLLGTTIFMIFLAGKIYRVGILMYGNKATLKEIWKWIKG